MIVTSYSLCPRLLPLNTALNAAWTVVVTSKWLRSFTDAHPDKRFKVLPIQGSGKSLLQNVYLLPAADFKIFQTATVTQASRTSKSGATWLVNWPMSYSVWCDQHAREGLLRGAGPPSTYRVDAGIGVGKRGRCRFSPNWSCLLHYQLISKGARSALLTQRNHPGKNNFPKCLISTAIARFGFIICKTVLTSELPFCLRSPLTFNY